MALIPKSLSGGAALAWLAGHLFTRGRQFEGGRKTLADVATDLIALNASIAAAVVDLAASRTKVNGQVKTIANELKADFNLLRAHVTSVAATVSALVTLANELKADMSAHTHSGVTTGGDSTAAAPTVSADDASAPAADGSSDVAAEDVSDLAALTASAAALSTSIES